MSEPDYLTLDDLVRLHDEIVERTDSPHAPLIHPGKLGSALGRPRNAACDEGAALVRQAVIQAAGISQSQAFLDGNKRAAFAAADAFLRINGLVYEGEPPGPAGQPEAVAEAPGGVGRDAKTEEFEAWLRGQVVPRDPAG